MTQRTNENKSENTIKNGTKRNNAFQNETNFNNQFNHESLGSNTNNLQNIEPISKDKVQYMPIFQFSKELIVPTLELEQNKFLSQIMKILKKSDSILTKQGIKPVEHFENKVTILLNELNFKKDSFIKEINDSLKDTFNIEDIKFSTKIIHLTYENLSLHEAMIELLNSYGLGKISSFEQVGHIVHFNLPEQYLPIKYAIGKLFIDKLKAVQTVVNKVEGINSVFREFKLELLAGEENYFVQVKEHGVSYVFDYSKVYWNSRLSTEHRRVLKHLKSGQVVCDMFAGVGPFAIPAATLGHEVYANDLNPNSYKYLCENAKKNHVSSKVFAFNMDGREFVKHLVDQGIKFHHVFMNLPASSVEFLDVFKHLFPIDWEELPIIHCYTFEFFNDDPNEGAQRAQANIETLLGSKIEPIEIYDVRDVSPNKHMYCVSFSLPKEIGINRKRKLST